MILALSLLLGCTPTPAPTPHGLEAASACYAEGARYSAKQRRVRCCEGLTAVSAEDVPRDDYHQDDYPPGCGPAPGVPPDIQICVACGDGVCGREEHVCNCPQDCPRPEPSSVAPAGK